jgi:two-component system, NarL family, sensor histidine kinase DesK
MTAFSVEPRSVADFPQWMAKRAPWFLVALHLPFAVASPLFAITRDPDITVGASVLLVVLAVMMGLLQVRLSLVVAQGRPLTYGYASFAAMVAIAYIPLYWFGWDWATIQWFVIASAAMVFPRPLGAILATAPVVGTAVWAVVAIENFSGDDVEAAVNVVYYLAIMGMGGAALYGSARLVRVLEDLYAARTELADLAVGRERLRVSRDLHDLLGQSLSAVSLKGDLALRLLSSDEEAARAEIEGLTGVARGALRDVRAVAHDEHAVSLTAEIDAAAALLSAAGIDTRIDVDASGLAHPVEEVFAWAVREGATNTLRHSDAAHWSVTVTRRARSVRLEIVNDGAPERIGRGSGLAGLVERAGALSGSASGALVGDGRFRLLVEIPEDHP